MKNVKGDLLIKTLMNSMGSIPLLLRCGLGMKFLSLFDKLMNIAFVMSTVGVLENSYNVYNAVKWVSDCNTFTLTLSVMSFDCLWTSAFI